jgi:hypothetical protein
MMRPQTNVKVGGWDKVVVIFTQNYTQKLQQISKVPFPNDTIDHNPRFQQVSSSILQ